MSGYYIGVELAPGGSVTNKPLPSSLFKKKAVEKISLSDSKKPKNMQRSVTIIDLCFSYSVMTIRHF